MADQSSVSLVVRVNHHHATGANHLRARRGDDDLGTVVGLPTHVDEFCFTSHTFDFGIGDGRAFDGIVNVRPQVFYDGSLFKQINENRLSHASVVWSVRQVLSVEIA